MKTEAEVGVLYLQGKKHHGLSAISRSWEKRPEIDFPAELPRRNQFCQHPYF